MNYTLRETGELARSFLAWDDALAALYLTVAKQCDRSGYSSTERGETFVLLPGGLEPPQPFDLQVEDWTVSLSVEPCTGRRPFTVTLHYQTAGGDDSSARYDLIIATDADAARLEAERRLKADGRRRVGSIYAGEVEEWL